MKLSELNESSKLDASDGIPIFFDEKQKIFKIAVKNTKNSHKITSFRDLKKIAKKFNVGVSTKDWIKLKKDSQAAKFQKDLKAMEDDIMDMDNV